MLKTAENFKKFLITSERLKGTQHQYVIPLTVGNSLIATLMDDYNHVLANLMWDSIHRQPYLISSAKGYSYNNIAFAAEGYSNGIIPNALNIPQSGEILDFPDGTACYFNNDPAYASNNYNCYYNNEYLIVKRCTIVASGVDYMITFNLVCEFDGDQTSGKNILMFTLDSLTLTDG